MAETLTSAAVADEPSGKPRRDYRLPVALLLVAVVAGLGYGFSRMPGRGVEAAGAAAKPKPPAGLAELAQGSLQDTAEASPVEAVLDPKDPEGPEVRRVLKEAGDQIKAKQYNQAIGTLNRSLALMKKHPEAYVLLGRALEGRKDYAAARDFYQAAIDRDPYLYEAYWGYATASEGLGDLNSALGAMRSYLHTEPDKDPARLRIAQARSALWEWESQLGRGPWGATRGIPPGFTAAELKRDGKGVAVKMPIPGSEQENGLQQYEIKHSEKKKLFPRQ